MKNIKILSIERHKDPNRYTLVENNVYKDIQDADMFNHRVAFSFELEEGEDTQYPLDDILDKYTLYVTDYYVFDELERSLQVELAGELEDVRKAATELEGKRAFNEEFVGEDGRTYVRLVIMTEQTDQ